MNNRKKSSVVIELVCIAALFLLMASCGSSSSPENALFPAWKFAFMSDNKLDKATDTVMTTNLPAVNRMATDMVSQGVIMVIAGGDMIDGRGQDAAGLNEQYAAWKGAMAPVYDAKIPVYAVPGNHEYWGDTQNSCLAAWSASVAPLLPDGRTNNPAHPDMEYSFVFNNVLFLGMNQNQFDMGATRPYYYHGNDIDWVAAQMAARNAAKQPHVVAFGHMPQFQIGYEWTDDNNKSNREAFWSALGSSGSRMYLTGHSHLYALSSVQTKDGDISIYQILTGSGGAEKDTWDGNYAPSETSRITSLDWDTTYEGYALVTIADRRVTMEWRYYDLGAGLFKSRNGFTYTQP